MKAFCVGDDEPLAELTHFQGGVGEIVRGARQADHGIRGIPHEIDRRPAIQIVIDGKLQILVQFRGNVGTAVHASAFRSVQTDYLANECNAELGSLTIGEMVQSTDEFGKSLALFEAPEKNDFSAVGFQWFVQAIGTR